MKRIYCDYAAGTPVDKSVFLEMKPYFTNVFANPGSLHASALGARRAVAEARARVARGLSCQPDELVFLSSGSASNNLAIQGVIKAYFGTGCKDIPHIITSVIEHSSVRETLRILAKKGAILLSEIPVTHEGILNLQEFKKALTPQTILVSIMYANNEIGTIQPIKEISKIIRHHKKHILENTKNTYPLIHTDAIQAMQYLDMNVQRLGVDLATVSSSKIYGPKGTSLLYIKRNTPLEPMIYGGSQESGFNAGTEHVTGIVGFGYAVEKAQSLLEGESSRLTFLRNACISDLLVLSDRYKDFSLTINGSQVYRLPNNVSFTIQGLSGERLVLGLDAYGVEASSKSACTQDDPDESYVVEALGNMINKEDGSVRLTFGRESRMSDISHIIRALEKIFVTERKARYFSDESSAK